MLEANGKDTAHGSEGWHQRYIRRKFIAWNAFLIKQERMKINKQSKNGRWRKNKLNIGKWKSRFNKYMVESEISQRKTNTVWFHSHVKH